MLQAGGRYFWMAMQQTLSPVYGENAKDLAMGAAARRRTTRLVKGGKEYFDCLIGLIYQAKESIHLQTYIYEDDETGNWVADALIAARKRQVSVHLLVDGYASQSLSKKFLVRLKEAGVEFRFFEPLFKSRYFYFGRRLHHKIFVADGSYSLVGGVNISDRYNDMPGTRAWFDFALYAEGEIARQLCILCWKTWNNFSPGMGPTPCDLMQPADSTSIPGNSVTMRRNDWVRNKKEVSASYLSMFREAQSHITILCSYFLPGKTIRRALAEASLRGVKVRIITAGPSDVMLAKHAERWLYDWLLRNRIDLYEYQTTILHAKLAVCDSEWLTIGSYNVNDLSAHASIELNLDVIDPTLARSTEVMIQSIVDQECKPIQLNGRRVTHNIFRRLARWLSYQFIRVSLFLLTFYYTKKS
jgi:cardiolipin synthase